ncbi:MAG: AgmX/PglI C-terminal domain-containing protein [Minicystis sp.]
MEATIPAAIGAPIDPTAAPADHPDAPIVAPDPPRERLAWGFPIGCTVVAAVVFAVTRALAPPLIPPEPTGAGTTSNFIAYNDPIGEAGPLPMPFISPPVLVTDLVATAQRPARARVAASGMSVSGRLPPEVVSRILRANQGRFRSCYAAGLRTNPNLMGRVTARFVIDRDGYVSLVQNGGLDMPDASVVSCVVRALYGLHFPRPDAGIVTVAYPLHFSPG